jgi:integrase
MMLVVVGRRRPGMAGKALLRTPCGQLRLFAPLSAAIGGRLQQRRGGLTVVSIARRPNGRWRPRYRDAAGKEHARHVDEKADAQAWLDSVTTSVLTGAYVDPKRTRVTLAEWAGQWLESKVDLKPTTRRCYEVSLRVHVLPVWGPVRLGDITHQGVASWVAQLSRSGKSASTVRHAHRVLSLVLGLAVRDGRLARNPAVGVPLPRTVRGEQIFLSCAQVDDLAAAAGRDRLAILFLACTGVRYGEMAALRVRNLNLLRRRALIAEAVADVNGHAVFGTPKTHQRLQVPVPRFLAEELAVHVAGKEPSDFVFAAEQGGVLHLRTFRRTSFDPAVRVAGLDGLTPHALRHTPASLAIASGANVKVVQTMLGHQSATMTLDLYGHLLNDQLDEVADAMDAARCRDVGAPAGGDRGGAAHGALGQRPGEMTTTCGCRGSRRFRPALRRRPGGVSVTAVAYSRGPAALPTAEHCAGCLGRRKGAARRFAMGLRPTLPPTFASRSRRVVASGQKCGMPPGVRRQSSMLRTAEENRSVSSAISRSDRPARVLVDAEAFDAGLHRRVRLWLRGADELRQRSQLRPRRLRHWGSVGSCRLESGSLTRARPYESRSRRRAEMRWRVTPNRAAIWLMLTPSDASALICWRRQAPPTVERAPSTAEIVSSTMGLASSPTTSRQSRPDWRAISRASACRRACCSSSRDLSISSVSLCRASTALSWGSAEAFPSEVDTAVLSRNVVSRSCAAVGLEPHSRQPRLDSASTEMDGDLPAYRNGYCTGTRIAKCISRAHSTEASWVSPRCRWRRRWTPCPHPMS